MKKKKVSPVEYFLRLLFPQRCIGCDTLLPINSTRYLCRDCQKNLPILPYCRFNNPVGENAGEIYSAFDYEGGIRKAIHHLKFNDTPGNAKTLVDLSYPKLAKYFTGELSREKNYDIIVPVPIHIRRRQERGYNQSELLARVLSKRTEIPVCTGILVKRRNTPPQSSLTRGERYKNLTDAFHVKNTDLVMQKRILLVDDVMTTGSTLEQCGKVLVEAGAARVDAFVIAVRRKFHPKESR